MRDYDEGYRAGMQIVRDFSLLLIEDLEAKLAKAVEALEEAKSEMRDWGPDHPAMKMIDAALEGQKDE
jgi:hypothetical protein